MSEYINIPLSEECEDFDIYSISISERIAIGNDTGSTENGGIITYPENWVDIIPRKFKNAFSRVPGELKGKYPFKSAEGDVIVTTFRFETSISKEMRPVMRIGDDDFSMRNIGGMLPLFNLDIMNQRLEVPIIAVEGEKTAVAAGELFPEAVTTTFMCGVNAVHRTEMHALEGRDVVVWPDNDEPGKTAMMAFAGYALKAGAKSVRMVNIPSEFPEKWDLADEVPQELRAKYSLQDLLASATPVAWVDVESYVKNVRVELLKTRLLGYEPGYSHVDIEPVKLALEQLDADMKKMPWDRVGRAIYYAYGRAGLALFDDWSKGGDKYKRGEPAAMWGRFGQEKSFQAQSLAWLFRQARKAAKENQRSFEPDVAAFALAQVEELNRDCSVVVRGSKTVVLWEHFDPGKNRYVQTYLSKADFINKHVRHIKLPEGDNQKKGKKDSMALGTYWFNSAWRREYDGVIFAPGKALNKRFLNLWRGFSVEPMDQPERWAKFKQHILDHICGGNQNSFDYILNWMALCVQKPDQRPGTALILIGPKGGGKSFFTKIFGKLFGPHTFVTAHDEDIIGRFNGRLEYTMLLGLEEVVAPQSRRADGIIKDLITREQLRLEDKFFSTWEAPNHLRIVMTSNNDHVVRADGIERRYAVFDVSNPFQDEAEARGNYFAAIASEMDNGGLQAMLGELLQRDIRGWNPEALPQTEALSRQKQYSVLQNPVTAWYYDRLRDGIAITRGTDFGSGDYLWDETATTGVPVRRVIEDYWAYADAHKVPFRERQFCIQLRRLMPDGFEAVPKRAEPNGYGPPVYKVYPFPPLPEAKAAFTRKTGLTFED